MLRSPSPAESIPSKPMRVLLVEDDPLLSQGLTETLRRVGHVVDAVASAEQADAALRAGEIDLVVLDVGLPGMDGFSFLKNLRSRNQQHAVLLLTARDAVADRVHGLALGADDYLPKPFATEELVARVAALARRSRTQSSRRIENGPLAIDLEKRRAFLHDQPLELTSRELAVLEFLFRNVDSVVSKERILGAVTSWNEEISPNAIEVYVSRLRAKIEPAGIRIRTVRGLGYLVEAWSGG